MFHNKKAVTLFLGFFFFLFVSELLCAASKVINSMSLDFTRNEIILAEQEQSTIKGKITYCKNPFVFIFQITEPAKQVMYINADGAFLLDADTVYDISENSDFLMQTCSDFLNWFKEDLGLRESHFSPSITWLDNGKTATRWDCHYQDEQPIDKVLIHSDAYGRFTDLSMYMDSELLVTQTFLSNYEYGAGFSYPTQIISVSYEENEPVIKTELKLSQIQFNFPCESIYAAQKLELEEALPQDLSLAKTIQTPVTPAQTVYRVSIPSVLVNTSFKFYKKFITNQDMTNCPFYPSCSQYMLEAVSKNGLAGFIQGLERLKRCTTTEHSRNLYPTLSNGKHYDPVPEKGAKK